MKEISQRGFWLNRSGKGHRFDDMLAGAIGMFFKTQKASTVLDLGCGLGTYVQVLRRAGIRADGVDGNPHTAELSGGLCSVVDLTLQQDLGRYDWVLSLEVGEHIPAEFQEAFLDNVTHHAEKGVILSWAIPGQGGRGHVNCRENGWVVSSMAVRGFLYNWDTSHLLRSFSSSCPWFSHTLMVFTRR